MTNMTFVDFKVGNDAYVYIHGLPRSTRLDERCIKVKITVNNGDKIRTMSDNGVIYDFSPDSNFLTTDNTRRGIHYKLLLNESAVNEYLIAWDMYREIKEMLGLPYAEFEKKCSYEDIKHLYASVFSDRLDEIPWVAHNVGKSNERYNASVKDFCYLITFVIEPVNEKWYLTVSGAGNKETVHGREYEFCSIENTLEDCMLLAKKYYKMIYNMIKEDLPSNVWNSF